MCIFRAIFSVVNAFFENSVLKKLISRTGLELFYAVEISILNRARNNLKNYILVRR